MKKLIKLFITISITLLSPVVLAHENNLSHSLMSGMAHPLVGLDHLLALILSGVLIARLNTGQCIATAAITLALGLGAVGAVVIGSQTWLQTAWVETAILFSIPLYFLLLWIQKYAQKLSVTLLSLFMIAHGWAHGIEVSAESHGMNHLLDNVGFMFGFLLTCITIITVTNVITASILNSENTRDHARL